MKVNRNPAQPLIQNKNLDATKDVQIKKDNKKTGIDKAQMKEASKLELSPEARQINKAMEIAKNHETTDDAKIERLQKMIDAGEYKVDAEQVADRLVNEHLIFKA